MNTDKHRLKRILVLSVSICVHLWLNSSAQAASAWIDAAWPFRRAIDVTWDAEHASGGDLAYAEFYSGAHAMADGSDIRVATEDGKLVASDVLMMGPGDRVRVAFALQKNVKKYYVFWGNPEPGPSKLKLEYKRGILLEMKIFPGGNADNAKQMERAWETAPTTVGRALVERPFLGNNIFGEQQQTISKLSGQIFAPVDGEYQFALAADDRGALLIDGKPIVFAFGAPGDIRFNAKLDLKRGAHDLVIYQADHGGEWRISLGWKRPDTQKVDVVNREALGYPFPGQVGQLEERQKNLVADYAIDYQGESWYADRISHRERFTAYALKADGTKFEWDFGDGQTGTGQKVDHVYLNSGVYPVKLTIRIGANSDSRSNRIVVDRQYERLAKPVNDDLATQSKIVATYNLDSVPGRDLTRAVFMHHRAEHWDAMQAAAEKLASLPRQPEVDNSYAAIYEAAQSLQSKKGYAAVESLWGKVPSQSNLQPRATRQQARALMWGAADFGKAAQVLRAAGSKDPNNQRLLGMALVLNGSVEDGAKILRELPEQGEPEKRAAISGAMARTIEFFIEDKDADAGDDQWDKWQARYPVEFLTGYSVVLKARLIETRNNAPAAAKLAEAFAMAVPKSSYAPQLLDKASKLLARSDAKHSAELRELLKQRYPEDPLSQ